MPNVWAHFIFGQIVLEELGESGLLEVNEHKNMFNMGCQGPDFLFYHRFFPWQRSIAMVRMGTEMHNRHCGPVMAKLLESVTGRSAGPADPDPSVLYALGFLLHHILDRNLHPYVFSKSGFRKWDHQRFEIMMDTLLVRELWGIDTWDTPVWRYLETNGAFPPAIVDAFMSITDTFYPDLSGLVLKEDWNQANRDFVAAQRLFHDPSGIKRRLTFGKIEPFVYKRGLITYDILNVAEKPWIDPVDRSVVHHESVWTLWDRALADALEVVPAVLAWLRAHEHPQQANEESSRIPQLREKAIMLIGNRSYETGLDCGSGLAIRYADTIWEDQPGITENG
ncbi:zinc dependent phospholipase C family protein [Paenibacillus sp. N4]|uniref:zinc dependent phospholipase C family protein n=1 Tax=Paenibacillus vietnamensis TaxID=2590547 RepID=UPI001CD14DAA|nr:zinc dependent phospholipase C family protein [Paenibacillus vietnamensis]MCA0755365.1 zinc dependent phospholipase C family protein [Paenibacillus vietnamensis]